MFEPIIEWSGVNYPWPTWISDGSWPVSRHLFPLAWDANVHSQWLRNSHTISKITYLHIVTFCQGSYNWVHGRQRQTTYYLAPRDLRLKPLNFCDPSLRWIAEEAASFQPWKQTDAALKATTQCHLEQRCILSIITDQPCHWSVDSPRPDKPVNGKTSLLSQADYSCCTMLFMQRSQWDWWCRLLGPFGIHLTKQRCCKRARGKFGVMTIWP